MAEELRLGERLRQRRGIHGDERAALPRASRVNRMRDKLLAASDSAPPVNAVE